MSKLDEIAGMVFGRMRVLRRSQRRTNAGAMWDCLCACGAITPRLGVHLRSGKLWACANGLCRLGGYLGRAREAERAPTAARARRAQLARAE